MNANKYEVVLEFEALNYDDAYIKATKFIKENTDFSFKLLKKINTKDVATLLENKLFYDALFNIIGAQLHNNDILNPFTEIPKEVNDEIKSAIGNVRNMLVVNKQC